MVIVIHFSLSRSNAHFSAISNISPYLISVRKNSTTNRLSRRHIDRENLILIFTVILYFITGVCACENSGTRSMKNWRLDRDSVDATASNVSNF